MAVEKAPVWTFPTNPKRLGRWYGKGPADRSPVGPGPAAARRVSSAMIPVRRFRGPQNMETDGIMRKEDGPIRHKEIFKESDGPVRKGKGWPAGSDLIGSGLPPRSGFHGAREGVPAACPRRESNPAPSQRRKQRRYRWGLGRVREGKDLGAPVGPCGGSWGTARRTGPRSGSSDHSSEPSVSAGAFALRRRETAMRAAPPPSTTTAASAISAMPAPVWARVLR